MDELRKAFVRDLTATMLSSVLIISVILMLTLFPDSAKAQIQTNNTKTYADPSYGYSLQYPSNWLHTYLMGGLFPVFAPTNITSEFAPNVIVFASRIDQNTTLDQARKFFLDSGQKQQDFQLISDTMTTLGGVPAHKVVYTFTNVGNTIAQIIVIAVVHGKEYSLTFTALPDQLPFYVPTVQKIFDSFKLIQVGH